MTRIIHFDLDSLRPDHLGCYGYCRNTSPNIDSVAANGVRFENYYCSDAPCAPSRAALMSGRFGIHTGLVGHSGTTADMRLEGPKRGPATILRMQSLPAFLRKMGIRTVSVSPFAERHAQYTFYAGFLEMYNTGHAGFESAEEITPTVLKWIEDNASSDNWYLHVNYWDPHVPYRAPAEFGNPFENEPLPAWLTEEVVAAQQNGVGPYTAREVMGFDNRELPQCPRMPGEVVNMTQLRKMIDGYDCGIRYMDDHIGMILAALEKKGVKDKTAFIISADHGENMGEFGIYGSHSTADYCTGRIPMIMSSKQFLKGHVDRGLHYQLDLLPTLAQLFNVNPMSSWEGRSFAPALTQGTECGRDYVVFGQGAMACQRGVRFEDWMYIRTIHDGYYLFPEDMLFNVKLDPHQQHDLAALRPNVRDEGIQKLNEWQQQMMMNSPCDIDPLWTVMEEGGPFGAKGMLKSYCERLEATGRGWAVPELKKRHPEEFK